MSMVRTFIVYVADHPGVLNRVSSLFRRRGYNIESLTVGHTHLPGVSRMTVVVGIDAQGAPLVEANLYKLPEVLHVDDITAGEALVGQGLEPFDAARLGVFVHGLAGDLARKQFGEVSLIATDLLDFLPRAFREM